MSSEGHLQYSSNENFFSLEIDASTRGNRTSQSNVLKQIYLLFI